MIPISEIERVIAELIALQKRAYTRYDISPDVETKKYHNGEIDGINISLHLLKELLPK